MLAPAATIDTGVYKMTFYTKEYFSARGVSTFYPWVEVICSSAWVASRVRHADNIPGLPCQIPFEIAAAEEHYREPLFRSNSGSGQLITPVPTDVPLLLSPYAYSTYRGS